MRGRHAADDEGQRPETLLHVGQQLALRHRQRRPEVQLQRPNRLRCRHPLRLRLLLRRRLPSGPQPRAPHLCLPHVDQRGQPVHRRIQADARRPLGRRQDWRLHPHHPRRQHGQALLRLRQYVCRHPLRRQRGHGQDATRHLLRRPMRRGEPPQRRHHPPHHRLPPHGRTDHPRRGS